MQIKHLTVNDRTVWDSFLKAESSFALLQSWSWGEFKEKLGWKVCRVVVENEKTIVAGAQLLIKPLPLGLSIAYIPRGPVGRWDNDETACLLFDELNQLARKYGAVFLKIEPAISNIPETHKLLNKKLFHQSRINNQPQTTILVDLTRSQDSILLQMRKKTRQYIRRAEREGISVRFGNITDLPAYCDLMQLTGKREHFAARNWEYYQAEWETLSTNQQGALLLAYYQGQLIAVRVIYCFGSHAAEFHAGSIVIPSLHPNHLLVWEAIKWAQSKGCVTYDLWGIPDEVSAKNDDNDLEIVDRKDGLWGVYQFKKGFGTKITSYIGAYDRVFIPAIYFLFNLGFFSRDLWERIATLLDLVKLNSSRREDMEI